MAGIYIHIPFCKQACHYCNFHFSTTLNLQQAMVDAIVRELEARTTYLDREPIETIYFGGGTPSLLTGAQLQSIFHTIYRNYPVASQPEITLEANPDDLNATTLQMLKHSPVNRLSIGIQSFREQDLQLMNRAHTATEAETCVQLARQAGFDNITIDLIYGIPGLDMAAWENNIQRALALKVPHLSAYCLTVEPKTALAHQVAKGTTPQVDDAMAAAHYQRLREMTHQAGFTHYEISNFALRGYHSRHNSAYWQGTAYLGVGPGAHSFNGHTRSWNVANNAHYVKALAEDGSYTETEALSPTDQLNEYLMVSLRTSQGASLMRIKRMFGSPPMEQLLRDALPYLRSGQLIIQNNHLYLKPDARFIADTIISDLFVVE